MELDLYSNEEELEHDKAVGQLRLALGKALRPLRLYGQDHYVTMVTEEIISLAIQFHLRLEGLDEPFGEDSFYHVNDLHW